MKLDNDGIPVLEARAVSDATPAESLDEILGDPDRLDTLIQSPAIQQLLDDLTEDVQKLVSWKIEALLKEELGKLIHEATESSAPGLSQDIRTQLQLALPELLSSIAGQAKDS